MTLLQLSLIVLLSCAITAIVIRLGIWLLPSFVSRERKVGTYRFEDIHHLPPTSTKLPNLGGVSAAIGITITLLTTHYLGITQTDFRWFLIPVWLFVLVGVVDDIKKWSSSGMPERARLLSIVLAAIGTTAIFYFHLGFGQPHSPFSFVSYFTVPLVWFIAYFVFSTTLTTVTVISVGFADGIDGLLGGLWLIAAIIYSVLTYVNHAWIGASISAALVGSGLAFLLFNLPSNWSAGQPRSQRRAKIYAGEAGALLVGAAFSILALLTQTEFQWLLIGGVYVLEGTSALYQAKIATPLFRRFLSLPRFHKNSFVPHTEFPLPFLATPFHCHLDLLGLGRLRVIQLLYLLAVVLGVIGLWAIFVNEFAVKVLVWTAGVGVFVFVWIAAAWTKSVFLAPLDTSSITPKLGIYQGRPLQLGRIKLYWLREPLEMNTEDIRPLFGMFSDYLLWRPMWLQDANAMVGQLYFMLGKNDLAVAKLKKVTSSSLRLRMNAWTDLGQLENVETRQLPMQNVLDNVQQNTNQ